MEIALGPDILPALRRHFPDLHQTGIHPTGAFVPRGTFAALLRELEGPVVAAAVGEKLGLDLFPLPQLITVRRFSAALEGRMHTDGDSKVAMLLVYLHQGWAPPEGCLRILRGPGGFDRLRGRGGPRRAKGAKAVARVRLLLPRWLLV